MKNHNRLPAGRPIPGTEVVSADAIAMLSRVNLGSVIKVIAALEALERHMLPKGINLSQLVRLADAPLHAPSFISSDAVDADRVRGNANIVADVLLDPVNENLLYALPAGGKKKITSGR